VGAEHRGRPSSRSHRHPADSVQTRTRKAASTPQSSSLREAHDRAR
jgi:hypothetical protein